MNTLAQRFRRDYDGAEADLRARLDAPSHLPRALVPRRAASREEVMQIVVDVLWEHFGGDGDGRQVSWVGFYLAVYDEAGEPVEMVLGPRRDKPACSPIGLHGACGRAFLTRSALVVTDVASLGDNYVACDPRDRSELVIPLIDREGTCWAVLDLDSYEVGAFGAADVARLVSLAEAAALTTVRELETQTV